MQDLLIKNAIYILCFFRFCIDFMHFLCYNYKDRGCLPMHALKSIIKRKVWQAEFTLIKIQLSKWFYVKINLKIKIKLKKKQIIIMRKQYGITKKQVTVRSGFER